MSECGGASREGRQTARRRCPKGRAALPCLVLPCLALGKVSHRSFVDGEYRAESVVQGGAGSGEHTLGNGESHWGVCVCVCVCECRTNTANRPCCVTPPPPSPLLCAELPSLLILLLLLIIIMEIVIIMIIIIKIIPLPLPLLLFLHFIIFFSFLVFDQLHICVTLFRVFTKYP